MAEAKRDQNYVTTGMGISSGDNVTTLMLRVDPVTGYLLLNDSSAAISPTVATAVKRDQNFKPTYYGISSVDNTTLVPIRTDSSGNLLIDMA